jgi:2-amino-4-hydroxy-6-hydroxymethyldihydropteridine diphosphokinase
MTILARPVAAYVALGANLGDPRAQVFTAFDQLARLPHTRLVARSSLYRTAPVDCELPQPDYINAVARIATRLAPHALLDALLAIEQRHGRTRDHYHAPRTLDLDLLLHGASVLHEPGLTLPHPRMHQRAFVLAPLLEIAPDIDIPGRGAARDWLPRAADAAQVCMVARGAVATA